MGNVTNDQIKNIVCENFDRSAEQYQKFEDRFGLFRYLTLELAESCHINSGMMILDIGCGAGTSTIILGKLVGEQGYVLGVDFSMQMLITAQEQLKKAEAHNDKHISNIEFLNCDADEIWEITGRRFNAILYNACIFLIPEPEKTLNAAYQVLENSGMIGMNYLLGLFTENEHKINESDPDLFARVKLDNKPFAPYGRRINDVASLPEILKKIGFRNIKSGRISKRMSIDELRAFYSLPAQSAALWPKTQYDERLELLDSLLEYFTQLKLRDFYQHWGWISGQKKIE